MTADSAHAETWLDDEYQLGPKVRDIRDHGASRRLGRRPSAAQVLAFPARPLTL